MPGMSPHMPGISLPTTGEATGKVRCPPKQHASAGQPQKNHQRPLNVHVLGCCDPTQPLLDSAAPHRCRLVDHDVAHLPEPGSWCWFYSDTQQGCINEAAGRGKHCHRISGFIPVILNDQRRPGFGCINTARHRPELAPVHSSQGAEIDSTKSWSSSLRSLAIKAACLRASASKFAALTSGTQICTIR